MAPRPRKKPRRVLADGTEALDRHPGALEIHPYLGPRHVDRRGEAEAGGADLVQRDAAELPRQAHRAADLVVDPAHRSLVGAHVGARNVVDEVGDRRREGADQLLLLPRVHLRVTVDHRFAAAMAEAGGGVLEGHRAGEAERLLGADVGRHADAADGRAAGDVVHRHHGPETDARAMDMQDLVRPQLVGEAKYVIHRTLLVLAYCGRSRSSMTAFRKRAASPPGDHPMIEGQ